MFDVDSLQIPPEMGFVTRLSVTVIPGAIPSGMPIGWPAGAARILRLEAWPNPFRDYVTIWYSAPPGRSDAMLAIYDVAGRLMKRFEIHSEDNVTGVLRWNGRDREGTRVPSGVYFCRLQTTRGYVSRKILLVR